VGASLLAMTASKATHIPELAMKQKKAQWPWHVLTALVLIGLAGALYYATSLMSYEWRWNRVPQYFAYHAEESQRATDIASVIALVRKGDKAEVTLRNDVKS
jgi:polar amino acid transport system permease protein